MAAFDGMKQAQILQACGKNIFPFWWYLGRRYARGCKESESVVIEKDPIKAIGCLNKQLSLIPVNTTDADSFIVTAACRECLFGLYDELGEYRVAFENIRQLMALMCVWGPKRYHQWGTMQKEKWLECYDKMAQYYYYGKGVTRDYDQSYQLYAELVKISDKIRYNGILCNKYKVNLARYHLFGIGTSKDYQKASRILSVLDRPSSQVLRFVDAVALLAHGCESSVGSMSFEEIK